MNISTSECSSGCESGWTTYLDQMSNMNDEYFVATYQGSKRGYNFNNHQDQEDEDLSMVSDASSGPPQQHFNEYDETCAFNNPHYYGYNSASPVPVSHEDNKKKSKNKSKIKEPQKQHNLCLDDTASSPVYHFSSQDNVPHYSGNHKSVEHNIEGQSITKKHLGFFKSSNKGKSGSLLGRKRQ